MCVCRCLSALVPTRHALGTGCSNTDQPRPEDSRANFQLPRQVFATSSSRGTRAAMTPPLLGGVGSATTLPISAGVLFKSITPCSWNDNLCTPVLEVEVNVNCRDEIIPILAALKHVYAQPKLRDEDSFGRLPQT